MLSRGVSHLVLWHCPGPFCSGCLVIIFRDLLVSTSPGRGLWGHSTKHCFPCGFWAFISGPSACGNRTLLTQLSLPSPFLQLLHSSLLLLHFSFSVTLVVRYKSVTFFLSFIDVLSCLPFPWRLSEADLFGWVWNCVAESINEHLAFIYTMNPEMGRYKFLDQIVLLLQLKSALIHSFIPRVTTAWQPCVIGIFIYLVS